MGYGLTAEIATKMASKYSSEDEYQVLNWISGIIDIDAPDESGRDLAHEWLKDGTKLCQLMNILSPGSIKKIHNSKMAFKQMENIGNFLKAAQTYGVNSIDLFQTVDLYENRNLAQVYVCMFKVSSTASANDFPGPHIGVKAAATNRRSFTEQQNRLGRNIIGLQMGTNKVASQSGMTAYGTGRQMVTKIDNQ